MALPTERFSTAKVIRAQENYRVGQGTLNAGEFSILTIASASKWRFDGCFEGVRAASVNSPLTMRS